MTAVRAIAAVGLPLAILDRMMPMNAVIGPTGHILHAGPTLQKIRPESPMIGGRFLETFEVRRPRGATEYSDLAQAEETRLNLRLRDIPGVSLKGLAIPLPNGAGVLVNLSFGIAAVDAVAIFGLSAGDFAPTDLTTEMLYLVEAKEAVLEESRNLNMRLKGAKNAAEEQAFTDTLTGLKNRRAMDVILARYQKCGEKFGMMHLDLDYFKEVNDTLGHAAGDYVLQQAASIFVDETRDADTVIRFGGDEFVLLFHHLTDIKRLGVVAERILTRLQKPMMFQDTPCQISGSIGITISDDYLAIDPDQMLIDADMALYASKKAGRAQYTFVRDVGGVGQSAEDVAAAVPVGRVGKEATQSAEQGNAA